MHLHGYQGYQLLYGYRMFCNVPYAMHEQSNVTKFSGERHAVKAGATN